MELKDLKAGDKVIIRNRWNDRIGTIERVTKTQIIVNGYKFRRENGSQINGDTWTPFRIAVYNEEEANQIMKSQAMNKMRCYIKDFTLENLSYDELEQICNILKKSDNKNY